MTAAQLLGNPEYQAICYGGYRTKSRTDEPTLAEIKEDLLLLEAMQIKMLRTYNVHLQEASNVLKAITELKKEKPNFEMYVMLGAWIDCENAWTDAVPNHEKESLRNIVEIKEAVRLANAYPELVKIIAVGNEAMVKWATNYYVQPRVILKWVNHLQDLKKLGKLPENLWITSSDNFASWGGGDSLYHNHDLEQLIKAVDYISLHTYPMHDTHYHPVFWGVSSTEASWSDKEKIDAAMVRAKNYAVNQYESVVSYMKSLGVDKPVHIGETGWASHSNERYGETDSKATDEYKAAVYYKLMREWSTEHKVSCFYFEAFDEQWKDRENPEGSENHFGLINLNSQAKYMLWKHVDAGVFKGLTRNGKPITKTYNGDEQLLWQAVMPISKLIETK
ncbi:glycosyl hydrolase family 17 [Flavobacterium sp. CYK-4]|uniref:glycosyl hydrolase family 17 n=1 Tax=Flavobacterium lotistagni TaxID=2709660 RepID=UPI00140E2D3F|nr:glycosyl hydrolase family 17 [Flavobacterium lotistagni]NHM06816.1 glycosyl hydrolase family 17 [Flavobacterium lotistagni]